MEYSLETDYQDCKGLQQLVYHTANVRLIQFCHPVWHFSTQLHLCPHIRVSTVFTLSGRFRLRTPHIQGSPSSAQQISTYSNTWNTPLDNDMCKQINQHAFRQRHLGCISC